MLVNQVLLECPRCRTGTLILGNKLVECSACDYAVDDLTGVIDWAENILGLNEDKDAKFKWPIYQCPQCASEALLDTETCGSRITSPQFICFSCGSHWPKDDLEQCPECGLPGIKDEFEELIICRSSVGFYVCRSCYEKIFK